MEPPNLHFVISAPRSGSTWLTTALNQHPEVFATEHRLFGNFCEIWKNNDGTSAPRITFDCYARAFATHYFYDFMDLDYPGFVNELQIAFAQFITGFAQKRTGKSIVIDKITPYPGTSKLVVRQILKLFPQARIIQLTRDGRDVTTSGTFDWLLKDAQGTPRFEYFVDEKPGLKLTRFFDDAVIEKWATNWKETLVAFDDVEDYIKVTYENMKADLPSQLMEIFEVVGAAASPVDAECAAAMTTFENMTGRSAGKDDQPTAKARKGIVGDWENYFTRADGELFDSIAGQQLIDAGYESDRSWVDALPESLDLIRE